jgi:hypothetical protein
MTCHSDVRAGVRYPALKPKLVISLEGCDVLFQDSVNVSYLNCVLRRDTKTNFVVCTPRWYCLYHNTADTIGQVLPIKYYGLWRIRSNPRIQ